MLGSEEGDILFLQLEAMFKMKYERKENIGHRNFVANEKKKKHPTI